MMFDALASIRIGRSEARMARSDSAAKNTLSAFTGFGLFPAGTWRAVFKRFANKEKSLRLSCKKFFSRPPTIVSCSSCEDV